MYLLVGFCSLLKSTVVGSSSDSSKFSGIGCFLNLCCFTSQYYFVLQSLHKARSSTTLHYQACAKSRKSIGSTQENERGFAAFSIDTATPEEKQRLETRHVGAAKQAFRARLPPILTHSTRYQTGWNVTKYHACHAKRHENLLDDLRYAFGQKQGSAADSDPGPFITILIHVCLQCPTFCTFSFILEICTRAFCPIFCMGACPSCAICIVVAMQTSVFSAWARFRTLILDALQLFWPTHLPDSFYDSSETERIAHTAQAVQHLLCPILHECLTLWAHTFSVGATPDRAIVSNHPTLCPT